MTTSYLLYITIIPETSSGTIWKTQKGTSWININTVLLLTMTDARQRFSISVDGSRPWRKCSPNPSSTQALADYMATIVPVATKNWFPWKNKLQITTFVKRQNVSMKYKQKGVGSGLLFCFVKTLIRYQSTTLYSSHKAVYVPVMTY
jgi:hypothetical protein